MIALQNALTSPDHAARKYVAEFMTAMLSEVGEEHVDWRDLAWRGGQWTIDGMDPDEWLAALLEVES